MSSLFRWTFIVFLSLVIAASVVAWMAVSRQPLVSVSATEQIDQAESVNLLLEQFRSINRQRYVPQQISLSQAQLNSLAGFAQRAIPNLAGSVEIATQQLSFSASVELIKTPLPLYINLKGGVLAGQDLRFTDVELGSLTISGDTALALLIWLIDWKTDSDLGQTAINQVEYLIMDDQQMMILLRPIDSLLTKLNQIKKGLAGNENEALRERTSQYLAFLHSLPSDIRNRPNSLARYMQPLFAHVKERSAQESSNPVEENEAALLALAIYVGHHRFANLVGEVQPYEGQVVLPRFRPLLAGRTDLTQHFVISAAIKILSMQGVSNAIGEFKELMDRAQGGSGFSFADLAADLAGVELAVKASDPEFAAQLQDKLAQPHNESAFFPSIKALPEGLSKEQFTEQFGQVESEAYQAMAQTIEARIRALPIYQ